MQDDVDFRANLVTRTAQSKVMLLADILAFGARKKPSFCDGIEQ